jgi:phosphatidylethanolamine-binding protein (PEBP) family uncharacterized protein
MLRTLHSLLALSLIVLTGCPEEPATVFPADAGRPADAAVADAGRSATPGRNSMDAGRPKDDETAAKPDPRRDAGRAGPSGFALSSPSFGDGDDLPAEFRCPDGNATVHGASPELSWTAGPEGTASYALVLRNVAEPEQFSWVVVNIPGDETMLEGNLPATRNSNVQGKRQLNNFHGSREYAGPCEDETSHYEFTLYALGEEVPATVTRVDQLVAHIEANPDLVLGEAKLKVTSSPE